jgi:putative transposase
MYYGGTLPEDRETRGLAILALGNQIKRVDSTIYNVRSQSGNGWYVVRRDGVEWACGCPDHLNRGEVCKHIHAVLFSLNLRQRVTSCNLGLDITCPDEDHCANCGATHIQKWGWRYNGNNRIQRYKCISCGHRWDAKNSGFERMRANPHAITVALDLYFKGVSLRKIVDHLKQFEHVNVSHAAVLYWIKKYVTVMRDYVDTLKPELSRVYHADETKVNIRGQWVWLWHLMDGDTRFLLANHVSYGRRISDAREAFRDAKKIAKVEPRVVLTDGLESYRPAAEKEFPEAIHVAGVGIQGRINNNRMERYHSTFKERSKVMRAIKRTDSAFIEGQRVYYDYLRPHSALNGRTPAEAAGLNLELGENKWRSLIKRAASSCDESQA